MSERDRLSQRLQEHQDQWSRLTKKLAALNEERDLETRSTERMRLEEAIERHEGERQELEEKFEELEKRLAIEDLKQEALRRERNGAHQEAIATLEKAQGLDPENPILGEEIKRLQARRDEARKLQETLRRLLRRIDDKSVYTQVANRLKKSSEGAEDVAALVESFLARELSFQEFMDTWKALEAEPEPRSAVSLKFVRLADRLKRGELVLFLGSDIPWIFNPEVLDQEAVVARLAQDAEYQEFNGSLSMIAEYYQMKPEYGFPALVRNLRALLPGESVGVPLYSLLSQVEQPQVLICSGYDTLLESTFRQVGKKFAVVCSLVGTTPEHSVGKVLVHYSDKDRPEEPCLEEELSNFPLLTHGYSVIYRVRGICAAECPPDSVEAGTLTLSEKAHFNFARHVDKIIPSYVTRQFSGRGLLFLGFSPRQWEDRLIVNSILDKRRNAAEPSHVVRKGPDPFEVAYWQSRGVGRYPFDLVHFVSRLEGAFAA